MHTYRYTHTCMHACMHKPISQSINQEINGQYMRELLTLCTVNKHIYWINDKKFALSDPLKNPL